MTKEKTYKLPRWVLGALISRPAAGSVEGILNNINEVLANPPKLVPPEMRIEDEYTETDLKYLDVSIWIFQQFGIILSSDETKELVVSAEFERFLSSLSFLATERFETILEKAKEEGVEKDVIDDLNSLDMLLKICILVGYVAGRNEFFNDYIVAFRKRGLPLVPDDSFGLSGMDALSRMRGRLN
ncbi:MAG: hypothetical protein QXS68_03025 [Candidatus Methanomethylicaceae archaeon]